MADAQEAVLYGKLRRYARGARDPNQAGSCYVDSRYRIENNKPNKQIPMSSAMLCKMGTIFVKKKYIYKQIQKRVFLWFWLYKPKLG